MVKRIKPVIPPIHNHEWLEPTDNSVFHPESDPRLLEDKCPACKEYMDEWRRHVQRLMSQNK